MSSQGDALTPSLEGSKKTILFWSVVLLQSSAQFKAV